MFQTLLSSATALRRHLDAPLSVERERYLQHCFDLGATYAALRVKSNELLWAARLLGADAHRGVDAEQLQKTADLRTSIHIGRSTGRRFIEITRPWLKFLGWWRECDVVFGFQAELDQYSRWMSDERGFSAATVAGWRGRIAATRGAAQGEQQHALLRTDLDVLGQRGAGHERHLIAGSRTDDDANRRRRIALAGDERAGQ
jgi:hypothetical protein